MSAAEHPRYLPCLPYVSNLLIDAQKTGVAQEAVKQTAKVGTSMSAQEARLILNVQQDTPLEDVAKVSQIAAATESMEPEGTVSPDTSTTSSFGTCLLIQGHIAVQCGCFPDLLCSAGLLLIHNHQSCQTLYQKNASISICLVDYLCQAIIPDCSACFCFCTTQRYKHMLQVNQKFGSFYLQSKVYRAWEALDHEYQQQGKKTPDIEAAVQQILQQDTAADAQQQER